MFGFVGNQLQIYNEDYTIAKKRDTDVITSVVFT